MTAQRGFWHKLYQRVQGERLAQWRAGELDDEEFERAQRARAWRLVFGLFGGVFIVVVMVDCVRISPFEVQLERALALMGGIGVLAFVFGLYLSDYATVGARNLFIQRTRDDAVRGAEQTWHASQQSEQRSESRAGEEEDRAGAPQSLLLVCGPYRRSTRFALKTLALAGVVAATGIGVSTWARSIVGALLFLISVPVAATSIFQLLDRRVFLRISSRGIWCRRWGDEELGFHEFKAAYPRQNGFKEGVVLVPRCAADLARRLGWAARYEVRFGDAVPAHRGTLTLWTTEVQGVYRDELLYGLRAAIAQTRSGATPEI